MIRWIRLAASLIPAVMFVHACGGNATTDSTSGNTNWLKFCDKQADCGEGLSCQCNTCQEICTTNADCDLAGLGSRCALRPSALACGDASPGEGRVCVKGCDVNADCAREDLLCSAGACVVRPRDGGATNPDVDRDAEVSVDPNGDADASLNQPDEMRPDTGTNVIPDDISMLDGSSGSPLTSGPGYGIACANNGSAGPTYFDCSVTFDADGNMVAYESADEDHLSLGNGLISDTGSNGVVAWGKWTGGPMLGTFWGNAATTYEFPDGLHYVVGKLATALPTGLAVYQQWGGTEPGFLESQSALVDYVQFAVNYSSGKFGLEMRVTPDDDDPVTFETTGGIADVSDSEGTLNNKLFSLALTEGPHSLSLAGHIVTDGEALALSYRVRHRKEMVVPGFFDGGIPKTRTIRRDIYGVVGLARTQ
jgi:hypothetical protein